jgi:hypothetical protein
VHDRLPACIAVVRDSDREVREALRTLQSFKTIFAQVESTLTLCAKGGIDFPPAFEVLMNSAAGRLLKNELLGAKTLTILKPRSQSSSRSPPTSPREDGAANQGGESSSKDESAAACDRSALNESLDQLEFAVHIPPTPGLGPITATPPAVHSNVDIVHAWLELCERVLGRAAVTLSSVMDLAHSGHPLTLSEFRAFRDDSRGVEISSCEPPSKEIAVALHLLDGDHAVLVNAAREARARLDTYDDLFAQIENAMSLCLEHGQDFGYAFDLLMRTDVGERANRNMHGVYDYSAMYD